MSWASSGLALTERTAIVPMTCGITLKNGHMAGAARHGGAVHLVVSGTDIGTRAIAPAHTPAQAQMDEKWVAWTTYRQVSPVFTTDRPNPRLPERSP